ncbi:MAG: metallophosphoesterase, partial [Candidatus Bathyarchaeia archaeon]
MIRLLTPWPALLLEEAERVLLVSDLHIGFEYELAKMGISIPYQTNRLLEELLTIIYECRPHRVIILGDLKHGIPIASFQEGREIPRFFEALKEEVEAVEVVRGNHDGGLQSLVPEGVKIHSSKGILLGKRFKVGAFHGHAWPSPKLMGADLLLMGHNHPIVLLRTPLGIRLSRRVWAKGTCDGQSIASAYLERERVEIGEDTLERFEEVHRVRIRDPQMILMPAFNDLLGGL